jgi:hypothetical protein
MPVTIVGNNTPTAGGVVYGDGTNYVSTSAGTAGQVLQSNGSSAPSWVTPSASGMTLLASVAPTAAANVDFLNTFSATYDTYYVTFQGIQTASSAGTCTFDMNVAVGGTVQNSANTYRSGQTPVTTTFNSTKAVLLLGLGTLDVTGNGASGFFYVHNANGSGWKMGQVYIAFNQSGTSDPAIAVGSWVYNGSSALSGFRLSLSNGANFAAQGRVRVYGLLNT